eukprot:1517663-Pleurochrysis_carterae.AAC.1
MTKTFSEVCRADAHTPSPQNLSRTHRRRRRAPPLSLSHPISAAPLIRLLRRTFFKVFMPALTLSFSLPRPSPDFWGLPSYLNLFLCEGHAPLSHFESALLACN